VSTMQKEAERIGIPSALITAIPSVAKSVGVSRIITGGGIPYPAGNPSLPREREVEFRKRLVEKALEAILSEIKEPTVFNVPIA
ncbi:MAG: glycine/betaine/sarcosine/D-proline family reductase selenoprotein B, partial [Spirochaetota bacterium]